MAKVPPLRMAIVKRSDDKKGFVALPCRWVVERTFSWFGRNRRVAEDFENLAETLATFVTVASIQRALRRLARTWAFYKPPVFNERWPRSANQIVKGPSPGRVATTRMRREQSLR
jgi:hypothetical protein